MSVLTRDAILAAKDWDYDEFDVPKWGGRIRIKALSAGERLRLLREADGDELHGEAAFRFFATIIALSVVGDDGQRLFDEKADCDLLLNRDWNTLQFVAERIMQFNSMDAGSAPELEKN
jgi:hypothetical protein